MRKLTMMKGKFGLLILLLFLVNTAGAQEPLSFAPVKWEQYRHKKIGVSFSFPKHPVAYYHDRDPCTQSGHAYFAAYAAEVVYQVRVIYANKEPIPKLCKEQIKFGVDLMAHRVQLIKKNADVEPQVSEKPQYTKFKSKFTTYWVIDDLENNKIFEIEVTHRPDVKVDYLPLLESVRSDKQPSGIDVKGGVTRTVGDAEISNVDSPSSTPETSDASVQEPIVVLRLRPTYTFRAIQEDLEGSVRLKIQLLANGSIGNITPLTQLRSGLTDEAMKVAKKIVFLPKKVSGINVNSFVEYDYKFDLR